MDKEKIPDPKKKASVRPDKERGRKKSKAGGSGSEPAQARLQRQVGNRALQRMVAQRSGNAPAELDDQTATRINRERGSGQELDHGAQASLGESMGQDFSGVRVHTSPEADTLNRDLGAKAFTTGHDIFFREGEYDPHSSGGKELLAHELTHVAQQDAGEVSGSGSRMTVNAPGDTYEQEADATAKNAVASGSAQGAAASVQRAEAPEEEEETVQKAEAEEEEETVQAAPEEEEEETVQKAEAEEEEEMPS